MANVNIAQIRSALNGHPPQQIVHIHASVLLAILNAYKASAGTDVAVAAETRTSPTPPLDLTRF